MCLFEFYDGIIVMVIVRESLFLWNFDEVDFNFDDFFLMF